MTYFVLSLITFITPIASLILSLSYLKNDKRMNYKITHFVFSLAQILCIFTAIYLVFFYDGLAGSMKLFFMLLWCIASFFFLILESWVMVISNIKNKYYRFFSYFLLFLIVAVTVLKFF